MRADGPLARGDSRYVHYSGRSAEAEPGAGRRINTDASSNPASAYAGKYVGIANGQVIVVTDDPEDLDTRLKEIEPDHRRVFWVDAGHDPNKVEFVWRC